MLRVAYILSSSALLGLIVLNEDLPVALILDLHSAWTRWICSVSPVWRVVHSVMLSLVAYCIGDVRWINYPVLIGFIVFQSNTVFIKFI